MPVIRRPADRGNVEQLGAPMELYNRPANEFVAGFLGAPRINLLDRPADGAPAAHAASCWPTSSVSCGFSANVERLIFWALSQSARCMAN